jgi:putative transposase
MVFLHKNIRLPSTQYLGQRWHFVTICCESRRHVFANPNNARRLIEELRRAASAKSFAVFAYSVMPDHLHVLVQGTQASSNLLAFVKGLKQQTAYAYAKKFNHDLWQKKFYDHILRPNDSVEAVAAYIWLNPVRKGLCSSAQGYPFPGSFAVDWKQIVPPSEPWLPTWKSKQPT